LSYSSKDKSTADAACASLEARGIRCWVAPRDILPGKEWGAAIIDGIEQSRSMVLVFSANANNSQQVMREVERAVHRGMPIIPFRIEDVPSSRNMECSSSSRPCRASCAGSGRERRFDGQDPAGPQMAARTSGRLIRSPGRGAAVKARGRRLESPSPRRAMSLVLIFLLVLVMIAGGAG